jgi:Holliday junction resolvase-like predicted endonuclease
MQGNTMTSNNLSKEEQIQKGRGTAQKGDWSEYIAAAHFRKQGYLVFHKMSGPIDLVLVHQDTGETRYVDVKYKNTRQGTNTKGRRINRAVTSRLGKNLKKFINIEIIYIGEDLQLEKSYADGRQRWNKQFKIDRNDKGQYNGRVVERG